MKKIFFLLILAGGLAAGLANAKIWNPNRSENPQSVVFNPDFKASSTKNLTVDRIEFYKDSTRVRFTVSNPSNGRIRIDKNLVLEVDGKIVEPIGIHGFNFGETYKKGTWSSPSFVMVYPAINHKAERLNVLELGGNWNIYGLRLDGKKYEAKNMDEWLAENTVFYNGKPDKFIYPERRTVVYEGVINGYDPKAFKRSFVLDNYNEITGVPEPIEVPIDEDGYFRIELKTYFPKYVLARYPLDMEVRFLIEPDHDIKAYVDRNVRLGQLSGRISARNQAVVHGGDLGIINDQIRRSRAVWTPRTTQSLVAANNLNDAKRIIDKLHRQQVANIKDYAYDYTIFPYAEKMILAKEKGGMIQTLLEQEQMFRREQTSKDGKLKPIPAGYYDFLKNELNDELVLSTKYFPAIVEMLNSSRFREVIGMRDVYIDTDQNPESLKLAIVGTLKSECQALCDYLGVKTPPLWWQIKSAMTLVSGGLMKADDLSKANIQWVLNELKNNKILIEPAVFDALNEYYGLK